MKLSFLIIIGILLAGDNKILKLDELIPHLLEVNPEILSAYAEAESYKNIPHYQSSLPNPMVSGSIMNEGDISLNNEMMSRMEFMVEQEIPFPLKLVNWYNSPLRSGCRNGGCDARLFRRGL